MRSKPLAIDLFCGLGGWTSGLLAEGWDAVGFDIERHAYGDHRYPAQLVLQDVRTIDGAQFRDALLILASSPCQEFSYRAMPWKRARELGPPLLGMELFAQAERIQREAIAAAGRFIPMVQENVRGAQKYVGRARWHYGSFYLWGDVPALMPITLGRAAMKPGVAHRGGETSFRHDGVKVATMGAGWYPPGHPKHVPGLGFNTHADRALRAEAESSRYFADDLTIPRAVKEGRLTPEQGATASAILFPVDDSVKIGGSRGDDWFTHHNRPEFEDRATPDGRKTEGHVNQRDGYDHARHLTNPDEHTDRRNDDGVKPFTPSGEPLGKNVLGRKHGSKSNARKAASARIAKIPLPLARWIAKAYYPKPAP